MKCRERARDWRADERGVSVATGYILNMSVAVLMMGFLIFSYQSFLSYSENTVAVRGLSVVGSNLVAKITQVDGMVWSHYNVSGVADRVEGEVRIPRKIAGVEYLLNVTEGELRVEPSGRALGGVRIPFSTRSSITTEAIASGNGKVTVFYNNSTGRIDFR